MIGWLTDGFFFRALDTATQRAKEPAFRTGFQRQRAEFNRRRPCARTAQLLRPA